MCNGVHLCTTACPCTTVLARVQQLLPVETLLCTHNGILLLESREGVWRQGCMESPQPYGGVTSPPPQAFLCSPGGACGLPGRRLSGGAWPSSSSTLPRPPSRWPIFPPRCNKRHSFHVWEKVPAVWGSRLPSTLMSAGLWLGYDREKMAALERCYLHGPSYPSHDGFFLKSHSGGEVLFRDTLLFSRPGPPPKGSTLGSKKFSALRNEKRPSQGRAGEDGGPTKKYSCGVVSTPLELWATPLQLVNKPRPISHS